MTWAEHAECRGMDPAVFHPDPSDKPAIARAKAICARCPVKAECRDYAIDAGEKQGVWGGIQGQSLQVPRAARRRGQKRRCVTCATEFAPHNGSQRACSQRCAKRRQFQRQKAWKRGRRSRKMLDRGHGTTARYQDGCRCRACKSAAMDARRQYRQAA